MLVVFSLGMRNVVFDLDLTGMLRYERQHSRMECSSGRGRVVVRLLRGHAPRWGSGNREIKSLGKEESGSGRIRGGDIEWMCGKRIWRDEGGACRIVERLVVMIRRSGNCSLASLR